MAPPPGVLAYSLRGWCCFERLASVLKAVSRTYSITDVVTTSVCPRKSDRFEQELNCCTFTNGREDFELVAGLYCKLFERKVQKSEKLFLTDISQEEGEILAEALTEMPNLVTIGLDRSTLCMEDQKATSRRFAEGMQIALGTGGLQKVQDLDMKCPLSETVAKTLVDFMPNMTQLDHIRLKHLDIAATHIIVEGLIAESHKALRNRITVLTLCNISSEAVNKLVNVMGHMPKLKQIFFGPTKEHMVEAWTILSRALDNGVGRRLKYSDATDTQLSGEHHTALQSLEAAAQRRNIKVVVTKDD